MRLIVCWTWDLGWFSFSIILNIFEIFKNYFVIFSFRPQIDTLVRELPEEEMRTMAMFSATMPVDIQKMASDMVGQLFYLKKIIFKIKLNKYVFMSVGVVGAANSDIKQEFHILSRKEKLFKVSFYFFMNF